MGTAQPPDPFKGLNRQERKRLQETIILEMAYDLSRFSSVIPRERPDFALTNQSGTPFGVEVTQLFVNESQARLNLAHGYADRLWKGGTHIHKKDAKLLRVTTVTVTSKEGKVRHASLPAIFTDTPTVAEFRSRLCKTIQTKSARGYDSADFTHINLIIHDWFHLPFNPNEYSTDRFFDDDIRASLKACAFREIFLIVYSTAHNAELSSGKPIRPDARIIPLQQLLALERFYVTAQIIDQELSGKLCDVAELNRATIDHVSRIQGYGTPVICEKRLFLHYSSSLIEMGDNGILVHDSDDYRLTSYPRIYISDRMKPEVENRVSEQADASVLRCAYAPLANRPGSWGEE